MSETKKARKPAEMGLRGWLHRSLNISGKKTAEGFLAEHRAWLEGGELAPSLSPILAAFDSKDLLPTPALEAIQNIVMGYILQKDIEAGERAMTQAHESGGTSKPWKATIYDKDDLVVAVKDEATGKEKDLIQGFPFVQRADEWAKRRLFDGEPGWYAIVESTTITVKGVPLASRIERSDAVAYLLPRAKHPFMKDTSSKSGRLSFGVKAATTHVTFSRG